MNTEKDPFLNPRRLPLPYHPIHAEVGISPEQLDKEAKNKALMMQRLHTILEPYEQGGFYPTTLYQKERGLFKKKFTIPDPKIEQKLLGDYRASFRTQLMYEKGKDEAHLTKAVIRIRPEGAKEESRLDAAPNRLSEWVDPTPRLEVRYTEGRISQLVFKRLVVEGKDFEAMFPVDTPGHEPTKLAVFLHSIADPTSREEYTMTIDLADTANPSLIMDPFDGNGRRQDFLFNPAKDHLYEAGVPSTRARTLPALDFCHIVDDTMHIIPSS